jgi:hypothetical protein
MNIECIDDGHKPGGYDTDTKLVTNLDKAKSKFLIVFDDVVDLKWCERSYAYAMEKKSPWGVYITTSDALDGSISTELLYQNGEKEMAIALQYTRSLIFEKASLLISGDFPRIHGTVVWCLQSGPQDLVEYHIDYAELYRYETNIIHPPLYAATAHVSPHSIEMRGGQFMANMQGLDHYKRYGTIIHDYSFYPNSV